MSKDIIYREDAIKAMEQRYKDILRTFKRKVKVGEKAIVLDMIGCVKNLPSADRPQGEWIEVDDYFIRCKCSICGWESHKYEDDVYGMPYCPNCGAHMKGIVDE